MNAVAHDSAAGSGHWLARGFETFRAVGDAVQKNLAEGLLALQLARMVGVLAQMSDEELARNGITRQDIPAHAKKLVIGER